MSGIVHSVASFSADQLARIRRCCAMTAIQSSQAFDLQEIGIGQVGTVQAYVLGTQTRCALARVVPQLLLRDKEPIVVQEALRVRPVSQNARSYAIFVVISDFAKPNRHLTTIARLETRKFFCSYVYHLFCHLLLQSEAIL